MHVSELHLRNFKSFKSVDILLPTGFAAIVGPNGSGKSNTIDSIAFVFGENSLKSMRVKKTSDLVGNWGSLAEVTAILKDDKSGERHELKRMIRKAGDTKYVFDGKRVKKYVLDEFLSKHRLVTSNIIKQGEVQRIVEMNSKDRRMLVDQVANISEYEQKKKEALNELDKVDNKLKDASTILGEREGYLKELAQEKEDAEKYTELKKKLDIAKASALYIDIKSTSHEFEKLVEVMIDIQNKLNNVNNEINNIAGKLSAKNKERQEAHDQIMARSEGRQLILQREIEELTSAIERAKAIIEEKKSFIKRSEERERELKSEKIKADDEVKGVNRLIKTAEEDLKAAEKIMLEEKEKLDAILKASDKFSSEFFQARKDLEDANNEMLTCKEKLNNLQSEVSKHHEIKKLKEEELDRLKAGNFIDYSDKLKSAELRIKEYGAKVNELDAKIAGTFSKERKLNSDISQLETSLMEAKTKVVEITTRLKTSRDADVSRAVAAVMDKKDNKKIFGSLEELCHFEDEYSLAVQVALGGRAKYLVVDTAQTASNLITELKNGRLGRASFIPLDKIKPTILNTELDKLSKVKGALGFVQDYVEFEPTFKNAFSYAFGGTILFQSLDDAKPHIGKARIVTLDGQLAEASGLMTGGSQAAQFSLAREKQALEKWEEKQTSLQSAKDSALSDLYSLRDEINLIRKEKAENEVQLKAAQIELASIQSQQNAADAQQSNLSGAVNKLKSEIRESQTFIDSSDQMRSDFIRKLSELNIKSLELKSKIDVEKEKNLGMSIKEKERRVSDLKIQFSEYQSQLNSLTSQKNTYEKAANQLAKQLADFESDLKEAHDAINNNDKTIKDSRTALHERQEEQRKISSAMKDLYDKRDAIEKDIQALANSKGKFEFERDKLDKEINSYNVKRAVSETNLTNLKTEYAAYEFIEIPDRDALTHEQKPQFIAIVKQINDDINSLGNVNLKAIELYAIRLQEFQEQQQRVTQLAQEKESVIALINEIEGKKINTFMKTFVHINDNFKTLFSHIFNGKGELFLENNENPFEGGLTIRAQLENKDIKYLELMSGGEKSLIALMFIFAIQSFNPASVYILDEADAALDQENSRKLSKLIRQLSSDSQFIVISHNQNVFREAQTLVGVAMTEKGSQLVDVKLA